MIGRRNNNEAENGDDPPFNFQVQDSHIKKSSIKLNRENNFHFSGNASQDWSPAKFDETQPGVRRLRLESQRSLPKRRVFRRPEQGPVARVESQRDGEDVGKVRTRRCLGRRRRRRQ